MADDQAMPAEMMHPAASRRNVCFQELFISASKPNLSAARTKPMVVWAGAQRPPSAYTISTAESQMSQTFVAYQNWPDRVLRRGRPILQDASSQTNFTQPS